MTTKTTTATAAAPSSAGRDLSVEISFVSVKAPSARLVAASNGSGQPGSLHEIPWRSATSIIAVDSNATPSPNLGTLDFVVAKDNVVFLGAPGTGKTHLAIGIAIRARQAGHRVLFATASLWVARLGEAHQSRLLQQELSRGPDYLVRPSLSLAAAPRPSSVPRVGVPGGDRPDHDDVESDDNQRPHRVVRHP